MKAPELVAIVGWGVAGALFFALFCEHEQRLRAERLAAPLWTALEGGRRLDRYPAPPGTLAVRDRLRMEDDGWVHYWNWKEGHWETFSLTPPKAPAFGPDGVPLAPGKAESRREQ